MLGIDSYGTVNDIDYLPWNNSIYIALNDGANGTVVEVNYLGEITNVKTDVLLGPTNRIDIIADKKTLVPDDQACRIEVFGGINEGYVTRLNADLEVLDATLPRGERPVTRLGCVIVLAVVAPAATAGGLAGSGPLRPPSGHG